ncbi:hypothetical protein DY000_02027731 [Brassica cretica]|uniref:Uncharacterized protein n=1 Tax=Brassica cretica TaxID=69181 RepID=A0ABQ7E476_BRACR|nr:hypothetical protein DY000_02027731 [Brassica cretica]
MVILNPIFKQVQRFFVNVLKTFLRKRWETWGLSTLFVGKMNHGQANCLERQSMNMMLLLQSYIPDDLVDHHLAKNGFQCPDEGLVGISLQFYFILVRLALLSICEHSDFELLRIRPVAVAVATQKFVADVASERKATNRGTAKAKQEAAKVEDISKDLCEM